jgi:hypothetical protein
MAHEPTGMIAAGTEVRVLERRPNGVVRVQARGGSPGWSDGRHLEEIPGSAPSEGAADFVPQLQAALSTCSRLLDDLKAGRIDRESFRAQAFRAGLVVRDEEAWLWDYASGWYHYDGIALSHVMLPAGSEPHDR